jgi:hypothetical protein
VAPYQQPTGPTHPPTLVPSHRSLDLLLLPLPQQRKLSSCPLHDFPKSTYQTHGNTMHTPLAAPGTSRSVITASTKEIGRVPRINGSSSTTSGTPSFLQSLWRGRGRVTAMPSLRRIRDGSCRRGGEMSVRAEDEGVAVDDRMG